MAWAAALAALLVGAVSPYLARLTVSVPDRADALWWRARRASSRSRSAVVAAVGLVCGALAGASAGRFVCFAHDRTASVWPGSVSSGSVGLGLVGPGLVGLGFVWLGFVWLGMVVTPLVVVDVEHHRLPDRLVFAGLVGGAALLGAATLVGGDGSALVRSLVAAVVVFALFCALTVTTGFGFGDTKLVAVLAGYLGWLGWGYVLCGVIAGFCVGALVSVLLLLTRRVGLKTAVPFGPALIVGALAVSAFGLVPESLT